MDRKQAKEYLKGQLKTYVENITSKSKGNMYICPLCGSGRKKHSTGAFSITRDGLKWKCFSCGEGGDIFNLIGKIENILDYNEQLKRAGEWFGITIDNYENNRKINKNKNYNTKSKSNDITDYTQFFLEANKNIGNTNYHRGLSLETINRFKLGYIEKWKHPKSVNAPESPRLIIPTSRESYLARDTRTNIPDDQKSYSKSKVGKIHMFNIKALETATKPIFIVEGELDALSIIDAGGEAIALGTTTKVKDFLNLLKTNKPNQPLIIALDNDEAGNKASIELSEGLKKLDIVSYQFNPAGEYKDANEALQKSREVFVHAVRKAEHVLDEIKQAQKEEYMKSAVVNYIDDFLEEIRASQHIPYIYTGFRKLDDALDGGLYEGLYIIGAIASLGKTTLMMQIADQIAERGHDVLIFSLEMGKSEIISKSISRLTLTNMLYTNNGDTRNAKTARGITDGKRYLEYNETEKNIIREAIKDYSMCAENIYIIEGIGNIGVDQIREAIKKHILLTSNNPVVIIDYIQILAPYNDRATDKQNTDKAVLELKRISRDYKIPVIGISSFNRANYKEAVSMESYKESGAIEYSSDVLIGLQLKGAGEAGFDVNEAKKKNPRKIELVVLKNRNGSVGEKIEFDYYPLFNLFREAEDIESINSR